MKNRLICSLLFVLLLLSGCYPKGSVADTGFYAPYYIADVNVPYADHLSSSHFDRVELVEQDSYGRQYFKYKTYSSLLSSNLEIHIICQKAEENLLYYIQDGCYMACKVQDGLFAETDIMQFKSQNDWEMPFKAEKYSTTSNGYNKDLVYEDPFGETLMDYLKLNEEYAVLYNGLEKITDKCQLFIAETFRKKDSSPGEDWKSSYYLVIYETGSPDRILACEQIEFTLDCQELVRQFREKYSRLT